MYTDKQPFNSTQLYLYSPKSQSDIFLKWLCNLQSVQMYILIACASSLTLTKWVTGNVDTSQQSYSSDLVYKKKRKKKRKMLCVCLNVFILAKAQKIFSCASAHSYTEHFRWRLFGLGELKLCPEKLKYISIVTGDCEVCSPVACVCLYFASGYSPC